MHTLRGRFAAIAAMLAFIVAVGASVGQWIVATSRSDITDHFGNRNSLLEGSRQIRDQVWQARRDMEAFLRDPYDSAMRQNVHVALATAIGDVNDLRVQGRFDGLTERELLDPLQEGLIDLVYSVESLFQLSTDPIRQFPAFSSASANLNPLSKEALTSIEVAMDEALSSKLNRQQPEVYRAFAQLRFHWAQMVSSFRMYLANRMGSVDRDALVVQANEVEVLYFGMITDLSVIEKMQGKGLLDLQASASVPKVREIANEWFMVFSSVRKMHESDGWRGDVKHVKDQVEPLLNGVWSLLLSLDVLLENSAENDVGDISSVTQTQSGIIWLIAAASLFFLAIGYVFFERSVLRPISVVSKALRAEADGADVVLPKTDALETQALVGAFSDMRNQIRTRQDELAYRALHDSLTNLPNRALLLDRVKHELLRAQRDGSTVALLLIDLDQFKEINDTLGHLVGDSLLCAVGSRLLNSLRKSDTVARLGGDDFAVLTVGLDETQVSVLAAKILDLFDSPFDIGDHHLACTVSIGISLCPTHASDPEGLLKKADVALHNAENAKSGFALYDAKEDQNTLTRLALASDLRVAIEKSEIQLFYQPQLELASGKVIGVEALLRWRHPQHGFVPPDQLVVLAEQRGLIHMLTHWVLGTAMKQCEIWHASGRKLTVSVNLSVYNLQSDKLLVEIDRLLAMHAVDPRYLVLEVTESAMMTNPKRAIEALTKLNQRGMQIAIDDYGTGYSSLAYIKQLPVYELKIDKSFVMNMASDANDSMIVKSTVDLAHNLGLRVVAEGIETATVEAMLREYGCELGQGYFYSKPIPAKDFDAWLAARTAPPTVVMGEVG